MSKEENQNNHELVSKYAGAVTKSLQNNDYFAMKNLLNCLFLTLYKYVMFKFLQMTIKTVFPHKLKR